MTHRTTIWRHKKAQGKVKLQKGEKRNPDGTFKRGTIKLGGGNPLGIGGRKVSQDKLLNLPESFKEKFVMLTTFTYLQEKLRRQEVITQTRQVTIGKLEQEVESLKNKALTIGEIILILGTFVLGGWFSSLAFSFGNYLVQINL